MSCKALLLYQVELSTHHSTVKIGVRSQGWGYLVHLPLSHCALRALGSQTLERIKELSPRVARTTQGQGEKARRCPTLETSGWNLTLFPQRTF